MRWEAARTSLSSGTRHRRCRCCLPALTGFTTGRRGETDAGHHDRENRRCYHMPSARPLTGPGAEISRRRAAETGKGVWRRRWDCCGRPGRRPFGPDAARRPKSLQAILSNPAGSSTHPLYQNSKRGRRRPLFEFWRRGWDYSALRASPLCGVPGKFRFLLVDGRLLSTVSEISWGAPRGRPSGIIPASSLPQSAVSWRRDFLQRLAERVGFEPTNTR